MSLSLDRRGCLLSASLLLGGLYVGHAALKGGRPAADEAFGTAIIWGCLGLVVLPSMCLPLGRWLDGPVRARGKMGSPLPWPDPPVATPSVSPIALLAHQEAACKAIDTDIQSLMDDRSRLDYLIRQIEWNDAAVRIGLCGWKAGDPKAARDEIDRDMEEG